MHASAGGAAEAGSRRRSRRRRKVSVFGVIGEILITLGVVTMLYVAWQLWIGDVIIGNEVKSVAQARSQQWDAAVPATPAPTASATSSAAPAPAPTAEPPALPEPADAQVFGNVYVPRFGADYAFTLAGGVSRARTLDSPAVGHYPGTSMPGQTGNFAVAGHRTTFGAPFAGVPDLHIGDAIVIETQEGWFTYRFRNIEYVRPNQVDVLLPLPQTPDVVATGRYITMTTCSPRYEQTERAVGYGVFDYFTPRSAGQPASLTEGLAS